VIDPLTTQELAVLILLSAITIPGMISATLALAGHALIDWGRFGFCEGRSASVGCTVRR
jgi:hypothetical protein